MCCGEKVCECCGVVHGRVFVTGPRASKSVEARPMDSSIFDCLKCILKAQLYM